jgi:tetratricopeptide (TPR) repeat protein
MLGQTTDALRELQRGLRLNPRNQIARGAAYLALGREDEAQASWQALRSENPDALIVRVRLAGLYESQGRHAEAQTLVAEIQAVNPDLRADDAALIAPPPQRTDLAAKLRRAGLP